MKLEWIAIPLLACAMVSASITAVKKSNVELDGSLAECLDVLLHKDFRCSPTLSLTQSELEYFLRIEKTPGVEDTTNNAPSCCRFKHVRAKSYYCTMNKLTFKESISINDGRYDIYTSQTQSMRACGVFDQKSRKWCETS